MTKINEAVVRVAVVVAVPRSVGGGGAEGRGSSGRDPCLILDYQWAFGADRWWNPEYK